MLFLIKNKTISTEAHQATIQPDISRRENGKLKRFGVFSNISCTRDVRHCTKAVFLILIVNLNSVSVNFDFFLFLLLSSSLCFLSLSSIFVFLSHLHTPDSYHKNVIFHFLKKQLYFDLDMVSLSQTKNKYLFPKKY